MTVRNAPIPVSRRALALLTALLAALALAAAATAAPAAADRGDNTAVAVNDEDGSTVLDFAFSIRRVAGDVVDEQNAAVALASCVECQTVAVALQVVLVDSTPSTVTPVNAAIALNESCAACTTVALAYQYVIGVGEPIRFTKEGRERIREIRKQFKDLERSGLPIEDILARVAELRAELIDVLNTQLETRDAGSGGEDADRNGEDGGEGEQPDPSEGGNAEDDGPSDAPSDDDGGATAPDDSTAGGSGGASSGADSGAGTGAEAPAGGSDAPAGEGSGQPASP